MARKLDEHQFMGMQRDASISKQQAKFLWEAHNIRLTAIQGDTLMSITNEKGTERMQSKYYKSTNESGEAEYVYQPITIPGEYVGHCVIGNYLVLFTHTNANEKTGTQNWDYIYRIEKKSDGYFDAVCLYGDTTEHEPLGFSTEHPMQTLGVYENDKIQKVYWTDGVNQPRFINIVKANPSYTKDSFDFVPRMTLNDSISVRKIADSSGIFGAGVVQYFISYYNKYGQESNISCASPLIPTSFMNRAGSEEEKIGNSFEIHVENPDTSFEYLRIYSIFRSSIDATPDAKRVVDIKLNSKATTASIAKTNEQAVQVYEIDEDTYYKTSIDDTEWKSIAGLGFPEETDIQSWDIIDGDFYVAKKTSDNADYIFKVCTRGTQSDKYVTWGDSDILYIARGHNYTIGSTGLPIYGDYIFGAKTLTVSGSTVETTSSFSICDSIQRIQKSNEVVFVDNGTIGDSIEASELLYIGGETITAQTIEQKDGTLFMGNVEVSRPNIDSQLKSDIAGCLSSATSTTRTAYLPIVMGNSSSYLWGSSLNAKLKAEDTAANTSTAGFKFNEHYRLGVQFQYYSGKWSEPVFIGDYTNTASPTISKDSASLEYMLLKIPEIQVTLNGSICKELYSKGYRRARALVVLPTMQDRLITAQGMLAPTVYGIAARNNNAPYFQSSWFFRPWPSSGNGNTDNDDSSTKTYTEYGASVQYKHNYTLYGFNNRGAEIQGVPNGWSGITASEVRNKTFVNLGKNVDSTAGETDCVVNVTVDQFSNIFAVDQQGITMHSPDFEFDTSFASLDLNSMSLRKVGSALFSSNIGNIDIQTSTPPIGSDATGFFKKTLTCTVNTYADKRLCAGLFYWDYLVDENSGNDYYRQWGDENYEFAYMVYPWQRTGSLNNDANRPTGAGTRTAMLTRKKISNIKYSNSTYFDSAATDLPIYDNTAIQYFDFDQVALLKVSRYNYYGNIDTLLTPVAPYGAIFSNGEQSELSAAESVTSGSVTTLNHVSFNDKSVSLWTGCKKGFFRLSKRTSMTEFFDYVSTGGTTDPGENLGLRVSKETISMKYKSTPHVAIVLQNSLQDIYDNAMPPSRACLYVAELYREPNEDTDFGGLSDEAKQSNLWIPAGEPVNIISGQDIVVKYSYGDTWFQRYDCLKTYAFTEEDYNSVIEIGSFMVETHVNIDGRYDKNRGQDDNMNMSPTNFNLINSVYSQSNNFFNYRILDSDYYDLSKFTSMVTWSTFKNNASDVDTWTTVTLASTLEIDGARGEITDLVTDKDMIYAFQQQGITQILFNSRVMVNTTDGVPIEISNNYKVDGNRYISTSVGCNSKFSVAKSPSGVYFVDSIGKTLYLLNQGQLTNISDTHGFGYWFSQQDTESDWKPGLISYRNNIQLRPNFRYAGGCQGVRLDFDFGDNDLYIITTDDVLCYSEILGQFVSFFDYKGATSLFNIGSSFHALTEYNPNDVNTEAKDREDHYMELWNMGKGTYNYLFEIHTSSNITFISNLEPTLDKIFTDLELRADFYDDDNNVLHDKCFDKIRVWDEYQDTWESIPDFKKKFRIWRCNIPRAMDATTSKRSMDRIRNTWCKIWLEMNTISRGLAPTNHMELHDIGVIYYG